MIKDGTAKLFTTMYRNDKNGTALFTTMYKPGQTRKKKTVQIFTAVYSEPNTKKNYLRKRKTIFTAVYTLRIRQKRNRREQQQETNQSE